MREHIETTSGKPLSRKNPYLLKLAKKSGMSAETIYRRALGDKPMSVRAATAISLASGGKISVIRILGLDDPKRKRK